MTMADLFSGPAWSLYLAAGFILLSGIFMLSGPGSRFLSRRHGSEQIRYIRVKIFRIIGGGFSVMGLMYFLIFLFRRSLPAWFVYVMAGILMADMIVMRILLYKIRRR